MYHHKIAFPDRIGKFIAEMQFEDPVAILRIPITSWDTRKETGVWETLGLSERDFLRYKATLPYDKLNRCDRHGGSALLWYKSIPIVAIMEFGRSLTINTPTNVMLVDETRDEGVDSAEDTEESEDAEESSDEE